ncbi:hypothetical protein C8R46DRAFT_1185540 [Mycena filopes]|nr:hypothetical protein C8R46DRAFT_1185540 [Mycena filopes]
MASPNGGARSISISGGTVNNVAGNWNIMGDCNANQNQQMLGNGVHRPARRARPVTGPYHVPESHRLAWGQQSADNTHRSNTSSPVREWAPEFADTDNGGSPTTSSQPHSRADNSNPSLPTVRGNMTSMHVMSYVENDWDLLQQGLDILRRSVVRDAIHNSAERPTDPACHPGTRNAMLEDLRAWSRDNRSAATDFAARCQEEGILGASFFFKRGSPGRGTWKSLFPTIAYQLATSFGELEGPIQRAVEKDKLVVGQAMCHQMQKLLLGPFHEAASLMNLPPIIVLDGLDECEDHTTQVPLLQLLFDAIRTGTLPVRVLVASRPEAHLREVIQVAENFDICRHLELRPDRSALADIRRYLSEEFSSIQQSERLQSFHLEEDWPGQHTIKHLVGRSSGTFIYAATVVRYIDEQYSDPTEQLARVLNLDPQSTAPLDTLYTGVLSRVRNRPMLRRILHAVVYVPTAFEAEDIDRALHIRDGITRLTLRHLHSLLRVPPPSTTGQWGGVKLFHASFRDFLTDPTRSMGLCIAQSSLDYDLVSSMSTFLSTRPTDFYATDFYDRRLIAATLGRFIVQLHPRDDLLPILYDKDVQQEGFMRCSPPPLDLIDLWEDLRFACELEVPPNNPGEIEDDGVFTPIYLITL